MDPMLIDTSCAAVAAVATSREDGRARWSELRVYHLPLLGKPWVAEALGCSDLPGETTKRRRIASGSLERALRLFDDSDLGLIVKEMAREYAEDHNLPKAPRQYQPESDKDMLAALFGVDVSALSINAAGKALGIGESSLRMALKDGRGVRVPLAMLFPFIDRGAFQRAQDREAENGAG